METRPLLTTRVALRPSDAFDPFLYSWRNVIRWAFVVFAGLLIYDTSPSSLFTHFGTDVNPTLLNPILIAIVFFLTFFVPWLRLQRMFWKYPVMRALRTYSFSSEGLHFESDESRGDYKWSIFTRIAETPKSFMFAVTSVGAIYIPKRCLIGPDEIKILRQLIRENFKGKKNLRST